MGTGFPQEDAKSAFARERRRRALASIAARLRHEPDDVSVMLPFEEVVRALGRRAEHDLGIQTIALDTIVGSVDRRVGEFDRAFRPVSPQLRGRWERIAAARRRGEPMPPIEVYRIGELHFVVDGHHRVSVARQLGHDVIDAYVTEIVTEIPVDSATRPHDLPLKSHQRLFYERVPLPAQARERIRLADEWRYAELAECVEAWGFRAIQARREFLSRQQVAALWFIEEFVPLVEVLREADLIGGRSEAEAYMRIIDLRYMLLRTHEWNEETLDRLREALRESPRRDGDTLVHRLLRD